MVQAARAHRQIMFVLSVALTFVLMIGFALAIG
jgi:hypothetical protein